MSRAKCRWVRFGLIPLLLASVSAQASEYNAASCQAVLNTLNIHWKAVGGLFAPCTGIEFTNGTVAAAAKGSITMMGVSVSNPACIGTAAYTLTLAPNSTTLSGFDTASNVPMTLVRGPGEGCFVGHWVSGGDDYLADIAAAPFLWSVIPTLGDSGLLLLAGFLALAGSLALANRRRQRVGRRLRQR